jgi:hypothetical protein
LDKFTRLFGCHCARWRYVHTDYRRDIYHRYHVWYRAARNAAPVGHVHRHRWPYTYANSYAYADSYAHSDTHGGTDSNTDTLAHAVSYA